MVSSAGLENGLSQAEACCKFATVSVGQHRALGNAGRAAGVLQKGDIVMIERHICQGLARALTQHLPGKEPHGNAPRRDHFLDVLDHEVDQWTLGKRKQMAGSW